jgi:hypothetical protein
MATASTAALDTIPLTQHQLTIRGNLPINLYRVVPDSHTCVLDRAAVEAWEKQRWALMMAWRWKAMRRCALSLRIVGPTVLGSTADLAAAAIRLMAQAGVIEAGTTSCVREYAVRCEWAANPCIEITAFDLIHKKGATNGKTHE